MKKVLSEVEQKQRNGKIAKYGLLVFLIALIVYGVIDGNYHSYHRIRENEPSILGEVVELAEDRFLLRLHPTSRRYEEYSELWVSLDIKTRAGDHSVSVGSAVEVYYDGTVSRDEAGEPCLETVYMLLDLGHAEDYYAWLSSYELYQSEEK